MEEYLLFANKKFKIHQEILSYFKQKDTNIVNYQSRFYIGLYKEKHLWLSITILDDCEDCLETVLFTGSKSKTDDIIYHNELGYYDVKRFMSPNKPYDNSHYEQVYNEFIELRQRIHNYIR
jgi:hypothetical protein